MKHAASTVLVIEFGSNTCKVMLWQKKKKVPLADYRLPLRLASEVSEKGKISEQGILGILAIIRDVQSRFKHADKTILIGTEALRQANNLREIQLRVKEESKLKLKVLSPDEEAEAAYRGIKSNLQLPGKTLYFDIGGASTEIISGFEDKITGIRSYSIGAVILSHKFLCKTPITACSFFHCQEDIERVLKPFGQDAVNLVGTGGSMMTCAMVALGTTDPSDERICGYRLRRSEITRQIQTYRSRSFEEIAKIPGMDPARADIILPAAMIILHLMQMHDVMYVTTSTRGVRHGVVV